ncbi:hypothetical protein [Ruminococcus sp.]|uniref:hypothetical protein n=1 Tax=Ruminococcus sp. TaxID=41978 RepID=UPI0025D19B86|nr:hypothetical protein [Ruminococcus sp.]
MGRGSYNAADWNKLKNSKGINADSTANDIFSGNQVNEKYLPKFITVRESRDSEDSPESTPIIIGFDSTGSMGYLAAEIAKNSLNRTATMILEKRPVTDPHIMCAAFTSPSSSSTHPAMQVTQFEADIRVVEQLLEFKLDGGNRYSYDSLVWYFALMHTSIDSYEKRKKKGFIFCIGDEVGDDGNTDILNAKEIRDVFNDDTAHNYKTKELFSQTSEKYEIFHIITGGRTESSLETWERLVPGRNAVIEAENIEFLAEVMISIMQLVNGMTREETVSQWSGKAKDTVEKALSTISVKSAPKTAEPMQQKEPVSNAAAEPQHDPSRKPVPVAKPMKEAKPVAVAKPLNAVKPVTEAKPVAADTPENIAALSEGNEKKGFFSKLFNKNK